jgi:hypothetical protein
MFGLYPLFLFKVKRNQTAGTTRALFVMQKRVNTTPTEFGLM